MDGIISDPAHRIKICILCAGFFVVKKDLLSLGMGLVMIFSLWFLMRYFLYTDENPAVAAKAAGVEVTDKELESGQGTQDSDTSGYLIVIDPGHGGVDPGMLGVNNTVEKEINLAVSYMLKEELEANGMKVVLTRTTDAGLYEESDSNKKIADMKKRCSIISENKADIVVSIHQNSFSDSAVCGAQVFYYKHSEKGKQLAQCIQDSMKNNLDETNNRRIKANDSYYMLIHTPCPTVIVECGFITNYDEAELLVSEEYQKKVSKAIAEGVMEYLGQK